MKKTGCSRFTQKKKKICGSRTEISHLPDNVLERILTCLSIQDAVRTSVLSRKWRYVWTKLPELVFDDVFCRKPITATKNKLLMTIYQILLLHRGPIPKFTLSLSQLETCPEIDQFILFVANNGIQEFTLHIGKGEPYKLPSSLFSCPHIRHLNLHSCEFKPPPGFKGFSRLVCLELYKVVITAETCSSLISSCPLLERLTLQSCTSIEYLEIVAPNLKFLSVECILNSIRFKNAPHLATVFLFLSKYADDEVLKEGEADMLFSSLPAIEFLELDYYYANYMAAGGVLKRLPTTLRHLKILNLYYVCFGELDEVSSVLWLLRSSPNLEKLKIQVHSFVGETTVDSPLEILQLQSLSDVSINQLREVEMTNVTGTRPELEFVKLLLSKSPTLEIMYIEPDKNKVVDKGLGILQELTRFRRASPQAEVTFINPRR